MKSKLAKVSVPFLFFLPFIAKAKGIWDGISCNVTGPCSLCDGLKLLSNIIDFMTELTFVIAAGMIIYGGVRIMVPPGDSKKNFTDAKKIIWNAILGLIVVLVSWLLVKEVLQILSGDPKYLWTEISC